jgi:hypothetical protein
VRVGRKRKQGKRKRSGDLILERVPTSPQAIEHHRSVVAASMPHRRDLPAAKQHLDSAESYLGRLNIINVIPAIEYDAGKEYRQRVTRYRLAIQCPRSTPHTGSMDGRLGASVKPFVDDDDYARIKAAYDEGFEALDRKGRRVLNAVNSAVIKDEPLEGDGFKLLRMGLQTLVDTYGLTPTRKSARGGK